MTLTITPEGQIRFIYDDSLRQLVDDGPAEVKRASHVEPTADGKWQADLRPVGGPVLGGFIYRKDALLAEQHWIERRYL